MNTTARAALSKLLRMTENAWSKNSHHPVSLKFSEASFPAYFAQKTYAEKRDCNAYLRLAKEKGAIDIKWMDRSGENNQIDKIWVVDSGQLASFLEITPRWDHLAQAQIAFTPYYGDFPILHAILERWKAGETVRGKHSDQLHPWVQSLQIICQCRSAGYHDTSVRRASAALVGGSKQLESLSGYLDVLTQESLQVPPRDKEEIFSELGLVKHPPTLLISGDVKAINIKGQETSPLYPYIGLAPQSIQRFSISQDVTKLLTVENLTTFHELALENNHGTTIVLYTGGMPSPSWKRVYKMILESLPHNATLFHWGDIDAGGFRIADHLANICSTCDKALQLHRMFLDEALDVSKHDSLSEQEIAQIERICTHWNWQTELNWVARHRRAIEQEFLPLAWPA
ncbi:MAG: DUF2220 domain-containing protein [Burkholderiaceae bacterium]|nr:DUF2220 domain-containing protein [Burkholderiaceae bacterium]